MKLLNSRTPGEIADAYGLLERNNMTSINKKRDGKKRIAFRMPRELIKLMNHLKEFHNHRTRNSLLPFMIMCAALDVVAREPEKDWSLKQRKAYSECKKFALSFKKALTLTAAERVLAKQPKGKKMTVPTLMKKANKEIKNASKRAKTS